ncbi:MAG: ankyrin repeat domain-containing protein [Verrucomicrobiales bacterium]|jgi:ankyrin repeat protein|nr:ankyrin repeat domain-containing protein [Verrucomicrobiales bacterium]
MKYLTVSGMILLCLTLTGCQRLQARRALARQHVPLTVDAFVQEARAGGPARLQLFLQTGMDIDAATADGVTPFAAAVAARKKDAADFLLQHGANINRPDAAGRTPLLRTVADGDAGWVNYLLAAGADPNLADHENRVPLAVTNAVPLLNILWQAGARPNARGIQGQPPIIWAVATRNRGMVGELLDAGADVDTPAHSPADDGFVLNTVGDATLEYYLKKDGGVTPLMVAAGLGDLDMVRLLLARGAQKFRKTERTTTTAIYLACVNQHTPVIQVLLGKTPGAQKFSVSISLKKQRLTVTRAGEVWLRADISTGAKGHETPRGEFVITNKYVEWHSTLYNDALMPFFMRLNCGAVGLHAGELPGSPASHGCIRLSPSAAEKIFQHVDLGTVVTIRD